MPATSIGAAAAASLIVGDGAVLPFNVTNAQVGVGNSNTAFDVAQTNLIGTAVWKTVSSVTGTFPSTLRTFTATWTTSEANFAWLEIGLRNGTQMLTRKVIALPTKTSDESWTVNLEVTFSPA